MRSLTSKSSFLHSYESSHISLHCDFIFIFSSSFFLWEETRGRRWRVYSGGGLKPTPIIGPHMPGYTSLFCMLICAIYIYIYIYITPYIQRLKWTSHRWIQIPHRWWQPRLRAVSRCPILSCLAHNTACVDNVYMLYAIERDFMTHLDILLVLFLLLLLLSLLIHTFFCVRNYADDAIRIQSVWGFCSTTMQTQTTQGTVMGRPH